jgi:hypothetical protein
MLTPEFSKVCAENRIWIFSVFLSVFACLHASLSTQEELPSQTEFVKMEFASPEEREAFFADLFSREFGYTLVGTKPISIDENSGRFSSKIWKSSIEDLKGLFSKSTNFIFKAFFHNDDYYSIELINRKAVRELVRRNSVVRSYIKKMFASEADFYSKIEDPERSIFKILKNNDALIGYLFGYDRQNINYYIRRIEVGMYLQKYPLVRYHPIPGGKYSDCPSVFLNARLYYKHLKPSKGFDSLEDEWQWIKRVEWGISEESNPIPPYFVYLPMYICRHGTDSQAKRDRFREESYKVAELFCNKTFREAVSKIALGTEKNKSDDSGELFFSVPYVPSSLDSEEKPPMTSKSSSSMAL